MKNNGNDVTVRLNTLDSHSEIENIYSSVSRYFKGASGSLPLKEQEYSILSALTIYFQGNVK